MQGNMGIVDAIHCLPKWKSHTPAEKVFYSILQRRKREFQQFIDQLRNQVPIRNVISSCYIIDQMHSTADRINMNIYIFDSSEYCKSLQLKMSIPKQYLKRKIDLLFYISSKNNAIYKLEDQCMYITCKEGQIWKTFYSFLELLFQESSENIIGVQFYTPLICKYLIAKELSFLLSPSSKSKCVITRKTLDITSIFKPSSRALIKACPKSLIKPIGLCKQRIASIKIDSKTMLGFQVKQQPSCTVTMKRKSINYENDSWVKTPKVGHEFSKKIVCQCHERNKWKVFKQVHKQPTINYTEILEAEGMFDNSELSQILSNQPEKSCSFNSLKAHQNSVFAISSNDKTYSKFEFSKGIELSLKSSYQIMDIASEMDLDKAENISIQNEFGQFSKLTPTKTNQKLISCRPNEKTEYDSLISQSKTNIFAFNNKKIYSHDKLEEIEKKYCIDSSKILIRDECKEVTGPTKDLNLASGGNSNLLHGSSVGFPAVSSTECISTCKIPIESQNICVNKVIMPNVGFQSVSVSQQPMGFLTASGKSLNVSEKAILAAQKMFEEVSSQEIDVLGDMAGDGILPSTSVSNKPAYPGENYMENEFNSDLTDKFFEEMPFDDKEVELKPKENIVQVSNLNSVKPQVGKLRKSLGGRRSLKPYTLQK